MSDSSLVRQDTDQSSDDEPVVTRSLPVLSSDCRHFLQVAAVLGPTFAPNKVASLLRQPVAVLLPVIDEALHTGVLIHGDETLSFHDLSMWREILRRIPGPVLRQLRREAQTQTISLPAQCGPAADGSTIDGATVRLGCLTDTERVITLLVGKGMTNRQVASRVYLSPHTVNYHLRRIFRKLDVRSRVELARVVHEPT